ncbi:MAG: hypothetical protein ACU85E_16725 [Gammaproteobacteria bacterium]
MADSTVTISFKRTTALWLGGVVIIVALLCYYFYLKNPKLHPEEFVHIGLNFDLKDQPISIPDDFSDALELMNVTGIGLFDDEGNLWPVTLKGELINLCGENHQKDKNGQIRCQLAIKPNTLSGLIGSSLSTSDCGTCFAGGSYIECNTRTNRWSCATSAHACSTYCRPYY